MLKHWDAIAVGIATFIVAAIFLAVKPGYTPLEVSEEMLNPPAAVEQPVEADEAAADAEDEDADTTDDANATAEATTEATEATE